MTEILNSFQLSTNNGDACARYGCYRNVIYVNSVYTNKSVENYRDNDIGAKINDSKFLLLPFLMGNEIDSMIHSKLYEYIKSNNIN